MYEKQCIVCGNWFYPKRVSIICCSSDCDKERKSKRAQTLYKARQEYCSNKQTQVRHSRKAHTKNKCKNCGKEIQLNADPVLHRITAKQQVCKSCIIRAAKICICKGAKIPERTKMMLYATGYSVEELEQEMRKSGELK